METTFSAARGRLSADSLSCDPARSMTSPVLRPKGSDGEAAAIDQNMGKALSGALGAGRRRNKARGNQRQCSSVEGSLARR